MVLFPRNRFSLTDERRPGALSGRLRSAASDLVDITTYMQSLTPGLYWKCNDAGASPPDPVLDYSGNDYTGVSDPGMTHEVAGPSAQIPLAIRSSLNTHEIDVADKPEFTPGTAFTVMLWGKLTYNSIKQLCGQYTAAGGYAWYIHNDTVTSKMKVLVTEDHVFTNYKVYKGSVDCIDGTWHHIAFTWDNGVLKLYVDGVEDTVITKQQDDAMTTINDATGPMVLCSTINGGGTTGDYAEYAVFQKVLTPAEMLAVYTNGGGV